MSSNTVEKGPATGLASRYVIRKLTPEHTAWAKAIVVHTNLFDSPVWPRLYPGKSVEKSLATLDASVDYLFTHQIESGLSWGIFDTEYKYKTAQAAAAGGALLWDANDKDATGEKLLEQMDFPLVSVALAYDLINPLDHDKLGPLVEVLPAFADVYSCLAKLDKRDPESWAATGPKQVLMRNATSTRGDYAGKGDRLMKHLAHHLMREAKRQGFRGIQIECLHGAVIKVWLTALPDEGIRGVLISDVPDMSQWEDEVDGKKVRPFGPVTQRAAKIYVTIEQ